MKILGYTGFLVSTFASVDVNPHVAHHVNPLTGLLGGGMAVFAAAVNSPIWVSLIVGIVGTLGPIVIAAMNVYRDKFRLMYKDEHTKVVHLQIENKKLREANASKFKEGDK